MKTDKRILLVAGGTGGHIWPAVSFGKWIEKHHPKVRVDYMCGNRPLEKEIYSAAECEPFILEIEGSPLSGSFRERCKRARALLKSFFDARGKIKRTQPDFVLVFGGYISFPALLAAKMLKIPAGVQEQNAYAGKVTRFAAARKIPVFSGWEECMPLKESSYVRTCVPVRNFRLPKQEEAWKRIGLPADEYPSGKKAVVLTGSLGSSSVKEQICRLADKEPFCRRTFLFSAVSDKLEKQSNNVYLLPKIWDTENLFSLADMVIMRAGGSSLSEAGVLGIASLVIPWKNAANNHQFHNAVAFASENRAVIWDEKQEKQLEKKLLQLEKMSDEKEEKIVSKLYNNADGISERLWTEISSHC